MKTNGAKIAAAISVAYFLLALSGTVEAMLSGISFSAILAALKQPQTVSTTIVCVLLAFGLWQQYRWAWWLGIVAALAQLGRISWLWRAYPSIAEANLLSQAIVAIFFFIIVLPSTRRVCARKLRA